MLQVIHFITLLFSNIYISVDLLLNNKELTELKSVIVAENFKSIFWLDGNDFQYIFR